MNLVKLINQKKSTILFFVFTFSNLNAQMVTTLAGSTAGYADGIGNQAKFNNPIGLVVDSAGNVYMADANNHRIRKIMPDGSVTTLAGSTAGFADGTGNLAQFNELRCLAIDGDGNIYATDFYNNRIRKITPEGVVSTFAGSTEGYADGIGTVAQFYRPNGIAIDASGNLFVSDSYNNRIRKITNTGVVTTIAGNTSGYADGFGTNARFNSPSGIAVDISGNIYVADLFNQRIRKITNSGEVTTFVGSGSPAYADGVGTNASISYTNGIAIDAIGNVYLADGGNQRIRKITPDAEVTTLAGSIYGYLDGIGTAARFSYPIGLVVDNNGVVFVSDNGNQRIRKISSSLTNTDFKENQAFIYPNPASTYINIELENQIEARVTLLDLNGRTLQCSKIDINKSTIDISNLSAGVYFIQIANNNFTTLKKFLKK